MSINVNVTGNPVSINRGQMFMSEIENLKKKEGQRRRKARIEQVRQQSKDIASNIRENNKKQTTQLVSNFEKQQGVALKKLTAKKLLNLHQQYNDCLENFGEAHRLAAKEGSPSRYLEKKKRQNLIKRNERNKKAMNKMYDEIQSKNENSRKSLCRKLVNRNVENIRSDMVTQLNKSKTCNKKKKREKTNHQQKNESENPPSSFLHEETNRNDELPCMENIDPNTYRIQDCDPNECSFSKMSRESTSRRKPSSNEPRTNFYSNRMEYDYKFSEPPATSCDIKPHEPDTRLSELISHRMRSKTSVGMETVCKDNTNEYNPNDYRPSYHSLPVDTRPVITPYSEKPLDIPLLEVTDVTDDSLNTKNSTKQPKPVEYYDHKNRYTQKYIPKPNIVQKTHADKGVLFPTEEDKQNLRKLERQRELDAQRRGREALNKERIKRDHNILLTELSNIHKGEQFMNTYTRNKDSHLSEMRLKDKSVKHQLDIEAAFENIYLPHTHLITLDPVNTTESKIKVVDLPESLSDDRNVRVGNWNSIQVSSHLNDQTDTLRTLLERVSVQRELLKKELASFKPVSEPILSEHTTTDTKKIKPIKRSKRKITKKINETNPLKTKSDQDTSPKLKKNEKKNNLTKKVSSNNEDVSDKEPKKQVSKKTIIAKENDVSLRAVGGGSTVQNTLPNEIKILLQKDSDTNLKLPSRIETKSSESILDGNGIQIIIKLNDNQSVPIPTVQKIDSGINTQNISTKFAATSPELQWVSNFEKKIEMKESSTSTSYLSPPVTFSVNEKQSVIDKKSFVSIKKTEPSQPELVSTLNPTTIPKLDIKTKQIIQKLLSMSRNSIDKLEVSSSDVCTPDLKVIQTRQNLENFLSDADETVLNEIFHIAGSSDVSESVQSKTSTLASFNSPEPAIKEGYTELAKYCSQRIDKLTEMIDQVRTETQKLHTYNPENTAETSYLQLPSSDSSSHSSGEKQKSSFKDILGVKPVQSNIQPTSDNVLSTENYFLRSTRHPIQQSNFQILDGGSSSNISHEYRSKQLPVLSENDYPSQSSSNSKSNIESSSSTTCENVKKVTKKPLPTVVQCSHKYNVDITGAPAKELSTIIEDTSRNVTDKMDTLTHNLQVTTIDDNVSNTSEMGQNEYVSIDTHSVINEMQFHSLPDVSQSTSSKVYMEVSNREISQESLQINSSKSSSDSLDEALKQLGLGWAITTLRKTQQTMQLSSSSSSNNVSKRDLPILSENISLRKLLRQQHQRRQMTSIESSSTSIESFEISPTIKQLLNYIPSTSKLPDNIIKELNKLDDHSTESFNINDKTNERRETGRTSTPVNVKKHLDKSLEQNLFTMNQSDISAIKKPNSLDSLDVLGLTIPDCLMDLSKSVQRSASS